MSRADLDTTEHSGQRAEADRQRRRASGERMAELRLTVDGVAETVSDAPPTRTLLEHLRLSGRVGTKEGCAEGDCGTCTVAVVAEGADGSPGYQAINSCLAPLAAVANRQLVTVEGVAAGDALHPVQEALVRTGGSQCGYCTPGFVMSLFTAYYDRDLSERAVEGNLCRCTGYLPIRKALAGPRGTRRQRSSPRGPHQLYPPDGPPLRAWGRPLLPTHQPRRGPRTAAAAARRHPDSGRHRPRGRDQQVRTQAAGPDLTRGAAGTPGAGASPTTRLSSVRACR